jgi:hypothetical protein
VSLDFLRLRSESFGKQRIDAQATAAFVAGDVSLKEALDLDADVVGRLRAQALALHATGQWQRVVDIIIGVVELGGATVEDLMVLAEAYAKLGDEDAAQQCGLVLEGLLDRVQAYLPSGRTSS